MLRSGNRSRDLILGRSWDGCGVESFLHPVVICGRSGERTADSHLSGVSGAWRGYYSEDKPETTAVYKRQRAFCAEQ